MPQSASAPSSSFGSRTGAFLPPGTLTGFLVAILAVLLIGILTYNSLQSRSNTSERIAAVMDKMGRLQVYLSSVKDAETGQRGYLLTGNETYVEPYTNARAELPAQLTALRTLAHDNVEQLQKIDTLGHLTDAKLQELGETIALYRSGDHAGALAVVNSDRGKGIMDGIRATVGELTDGEQRSLTAYQAEWKEAALNSSIVTLGGAGLLLVLIVIGAVMSSRDFRARETEAWLRSGQADLSARIQGEQRLEVLGDTILEFLAKYLDARVGALYVTADGGRFQRVAGYALPLDGKDRAIDPGEGLLGQAARQNSAMRVRDVPEDYFFVTSATGRGKPRELLLAPAASDGRVQAVMELGFLHALQPADEELLNRLSEMIGVAVRSSKDRSRLESLLEETQRQAEELQAQQEELRVNNEELEEQGRALKQSQAQLETQQAELQQTNAQLEEHTQALEQQKDELAEAQATLSEKAADLERSNQFKSEFLANMSHELRTPLNSSLILAKLLADNKEGNLNTEQVKFAQTISAAGNDLLELINDILDLSKIEAGKIEVQPEAVSLTAVVDGLSKTFQPAAREKTLSFKAEIEPGLQDSMTTDPLRLAQILKNLISNALKFTERGEIALTVSQAARGGIAFAVKDTGIGIPAEQQAIIFEAFRQADGSTHRKYGGTGLGLSISRNLAHLLGGDIAIASTPGQGSTFTLTLPVTYTGPLAVDKTPVLAAAAPSASPRTAAAAPARIPMEGRPPAAPAAEDDRGSLRPGNKLILVIEDDARFAGILRDLAHEMQFQCVIAHSANEGLSAAAMYHPSAIVLDINLPDHSGLGVLDQLKRNPATRHIPVHVASVADYMHEAMGLGAVGYALKPVKREELAQALKRLEEKFSQDVRQVLIVEDDDRQRESMRQLLDNGNVQITSVTTAAEALEQLGRSTFDCMVMDLNLPDLSGYELLEKMAGQEHMPFPPVIVYTGRSLTRDEEQKLGRYSRSIIIKDARSPERLLDEVTLFLHQVESKLPQEQQRMLKVARDRDVLLEGRRVLVVEDDVRNIFALSSVLERQGMTLEIARNGLEAIEALERSTLRKGGGVDLVLMDIMMPEMDGLTAMREIRKRPEWKKLPIIALTAKAMRDDQEKCMAAGANDYIAKPLDVEKLLSLVRVWMPK